MAPPAFPLWRYYPANKRPEPWVHELVGVVATARESIDTAFVTTGLTSDSVLKVLAPGLAAIGYSIEQGKNVGQRLRRPVLFGDQGAELETYDVDGWHEQSGITLEVEAGRGAMGNAIFRDLIRTSLIADARYLALGLMVSYRFRSSGKLMTTKSYEDGRRILDSVYASGRLRLPFEGILLFGY